MKTFTLASLTLSALLSVLPAQAADRVVLDFDCHAKALPGLQAFARAAGLANAGDAYEQRRKAQFQLLRTCKGGFDRVQLVRRDVAGRDPLWLVQR